MTIFSVYNNTYRKLAVTLQPVMIECCSLYQNDQK